jgi:hypothetical protein
METVPARTIGHNVVAHGHSLSPLDCGVSGLVVAMFVMEGDRLGEWELRSALVAKESQHEQSKSIRLLCPFSSYGLGFMTASYVVVTTHVTPSVFGPPHFMKCIRPALTLAEAKRGSASPAAPILRSIPGPMLS